MRCIMEIVHHTSQPRRPNPFLVLDAGSSGTRNFPANFFCNTGRFSNFVTDPVPRLPSLGRRVGPIETSNGCQAGPGRDSTRKAAAHPLKHPRSLSPERPLELQEILAGICYLLYASLP